MEKKKIIIFVSIYFIFSIINLLINPIMLKKQIIFYIVGFIILIMNKKGFIKYIFEIYILFNILLLYLLLFGSEVNGSKAWINVGFISLQPSEFMKVILIILLSLIALKYDKYKLKCFIIALIPSILTFLEPDTGNVLFYLIIFLSIIIYKEKNVKKYILPCLIILFIISCFFLLYFKFQNTFINIFGISYFYRMDRIVNLFNSNSYQLNMALIAMGSSYLFGGNVVTDIPEKTTDFAFSLLITRIGLIGGLIYLIINFSFNYLLISNLKKVYGIKKIIMHSFIILKLVQELVHILMNIGLFPITGIPLPFISYGGSSLITYFILLLLISNNMDDYSNNLGNKVLGYNIQV